MLRQSESEVNARPCRPGAGLEQVLYAVWGRAARVLSSALCMGLFAKKRLTDYADCAG